MMERTCLRRDDNRRDDCAVGLRAILLGEHGAPAFDAKPLAHHLLGAGGRWPPDDVEQPPPPAPPLLALAMDAFFANSTGAYGISIATPERVLCKRHSPFGADRVTPSWSTSSAITCTLIGRSINQGWLAPVHR